MKPETLKESLISGSATLAVAGLGYVGLPLALEFSCRVPVIGFDTDAKRVEACRKQYAASDLTVKFTDNPASLSEAAMIIVAVPTPVNADHTPDLSCLEQISRLIGQNLSEQTTVVFESTVYPGTTEKVCVPLIEQESGMHCGNQWTIGYSPERINPGDPVHTLKTIRKIVAGMDPQSTKTIQEVYDLIIEPGTYAAPDIRTAEAAKVIENSQRDVNTAFMNEAAKICHAMGVDTREVMKAMATKWNALNFYPGLVGGHCIGVDPYYLISAAHKCGCDTEVLTSSRAVNESMGVYVANAALQEMRTAGLDPERAVIRILGITFKEDCPDIRNSRVMDIIRHLQQAGVSCLVTDCLADPEEVKTMYGIDLVPPDQGPGADCVILAVPHQEYRKPGLKALLRLYHRPSSARQPVLIDVRSVFSRSEAREAGLRYWSL